MTRSRHLTPIALTLFAMGIVAQADAFEAFAPEGSATSRPDSSVAVPPPPPAARPSVRAYDLNGQSIKVDGRLDDPAWRPADGGRGFRVWDPDRGASPSEDTMFKVAYDEDAIYVGVACFEKDPSKIAAKLTRRDSFSNSDLVTVYLDPYHDRTTGYSFRVNPLGVQEDAYWYNDDQKDVDWNAVWEAETYRDDQGWYVEMRIPFSAIRYRNAPSMTWGLQVTRYMQTRGQDTSWITWDRETRGFVSRFGDLADVRGIRNPRQLEMLPYVVQRSTDPSMLGGGDDIDNYENLGADLKYGITADMALNATVQPDFGQVEADPAVLNLSPFETFYAEKRPFFIEGSRFFEHPDFNLFYSRRIGTGDADSRIRYAAKLTGKTLGGLSVAALAASADLTGHGQAHNLFKNGERLSRYFVGRFGKEFSGGKHRINFMQTATWNTANRDSFGDLASREAYTTGADFDVNLRNREFNLHGSYVSSIIAPERSGLDPLADAAKRYGSGGNLALGKLGGRWRGSVSGRWESGKLDLNDLGFLESPDEINSNGWVQYNYNPEGKSKRLNRANVNFNIWRNWLYAGRTGWDVNTGQVAWSYGRGHPTFVGGNVNGWMQFRDYREAWWGLFYQADGTQRYETRGGPLIGEPGTYGVWSGIGTDTRKDLKFTLEARYYWDHANNISTDVTLGSHWNQSSAVSHDLSVAFHGRTDDTQYLKTVNVATTPGGVGIGGLSYVFGDIRQRTVDVTLRSNVLFSRTQSLEIYAQPFLSVGNYTGVRELLEADTYDLVRYDEPGFTASDSDFRLAAVNVNAVYRWEYRPGSTFFLVWTQSRAEYDQRNFHPSDPNGFRNNLSAGSLFGNEPENTIQAKVTYWLAI